MERIHQIRRLLLRSRRLPWVVIGITLAIMGGAIFLTSKQTRSRVRAQIIGRDREILYAVTRMQMLRAAEAEELVGTMEDPANQLNVIMESARLTQLSGVIGAALFTPTGALVQSYPGDLLDGGIEPADLTTLRVLKPVSRFYHSLAMSEIFLFGPSEKLPVLEISVPLHTASESRLLGIAQFVIEGNGIAQQFSQLDWHLWRQGLATFLASGAILALALGWSFRRLHHAHRLLAERTETLLKANQELTLVAKTSAVGAVTSHLIHGLKNPLAGLQSFVAGLGATVAEQSGPDLEQAIAATRRMQVMINEVLAVLREEDNAGQYEIPLAELKELILGKAQALCRERQVRLSTTCDTPAVLPNRAANLVALVLANLVQNAIEATPHGGEARLLILPAGQDILCEVHDQGGGFPAGHQPFVPCSSTKDGGSGIGLAISKQLAHHLGARLELRRSTPAGCVFALMLPASLTNSANPKNNSVTVSLG
jgi:signal transduction histidine kinase